MTLEMQEFVFVRVSNFKRIILLFLLANTWCAGGIPINGGNNYHEYNGNQQFSNQQRSASGHHTHQLNTLNHGPESEEFQRLHTNQQRKFQRQAGPPFPPDVERKSTAGFHQTQPEQIRPNFRHHEIDDSFQQKQQHQHDQFHNDIRMQPPPYFSRVQNDEFQDFPRRSQGPPFSPGSGYFSDSSLNTNYPHEGHRFAPIPDQHNPQSQNEMGKNSYTNQNPSGHRNSLPSDHLKPPMGYWRDEQLPLQQKSVNSAKIPDRTGSHGKPPTGLDSPPQSTPVATLDRFGKGNSTLSIEYDISDKDVTYETTMEVEDVPDSLIPSVSTNSIH